MTDYVDWDVALEAIRKMDAADLCPLCRDDTDPDHETWCEARLHRRQVEALERIANALDEITKVYINT